MLPCTCLCVVLINKIPIRGSKGESDYSFLHNRKGNLRGNLGTASLNTYPQQLHYFITLRLPPLLQPLRADISRDRNKRVSGSSGPEEDRLLKEGAVKDGADCHPFTLSPAELKHSSRKKLFVFMCCIPFDLIRFTEHYLNMKRGSWQGLLWQTVLRIQQNDNLKNGQSVLFVLCTTREINAAAGLRPQKPIVGFRQSINLSLPLSLPICLFLLVCLQEFARDCRDSPL